MGNVCGTKQNVCDRFPTDDEVTDVSLRDISDVFDDVMFRDYMEGKHELVENMTTRGSSFLNKTGKQLYKELHVEIQSNCSSTDSLLPPLSTRNSSDHSFFGEKSQHDFGLRIQNPRPMPLCFRGPRTPPGSPRCFDSDCKSQFSASNTPPSSDFESSFQSTPPQSQPHPPTGKHFSMSSDEDNLSEKEQGKPSFDKSIWIWPTDDTSSRKPPKLKLKEPTQQDWPSTRLPQFTPLVYKKTKNPT